MDIDAKLPADSGASSASDRRPAGTLAAGSESPLVGYDMLVQISQNEINSQFARMFGSQILPEVVGNGVGTGGFGGGQEVLTSYLRGYIDAPEVTLAAAGNQSNSLSTQFYFTFQEQTVTAAGMGVTDAEMQAAFVDSPDGVAGLLVKQENIPYTDAGGQSQTLADQSIGYWLNRTAQPSGSQNYVYTLIPALMFSDGTSSGMVSLLGLQLQFEVLLASIPTSAAAIATGVANGVLPAELSTTITDNAFDSSEFGLTQLFLDFDTVDFTQWALANPAQGLGATVDLLEFGANGSFSLASETLQQFLSDASFAAAFSVTLESVFGYGAAASAGASPYIIGVSVQSNDPATTDPGQPPSVVPTYVGFSATPNASDPGLSAVSYQILCGADSADVPKNNDGTVIDVTTNTIASNDYSGELFYARSVFFDPLVFAPITTALNATCNGSDTITWTQNGNVWSGAYVTTVVLTTRTGNPTSSVTRSYNNAFTLSVNDGAEVEVTGNIAVTVEIDVVYDVFGDSYSFVWTKEDTSQLQFTSSAVVDVNNNLKFVTTGGFSGVIQGAIERNNAAKFLDAVLQLLTGLSDQYQSPMDQAIVQLGNDTASQLFQAMNEFNTNLASSVTTRFISPTGEVFLLNAPRYTSDFDLEMDVTYNV